MATVMDIMTWFLARVIEYSFSAFASWEHFIAALGELAGTFTDLASGLAWPYLLSSFVIAVVAFLLKRPNQVKPSRSFTAFLLPRRIYRHPSAVLDYRFYVINTLLRVLLWGPMLVGLGVLGGKLTALAFPNLASWSPQPTLPPIYLFGAALGFYLLYDFGSYWTHMMFHKVPLLWSFHKVHHSAEVLMPITGFRAHPMEFFVFTIMRAPVAVLAAVFYQNVPGPDVGVTAIFGISVVAFTYALSGFHLQHSHLPISYGPVLNRIIVSPILHQVHHSLDPKHLNKNFGVRFSSWDWLFGTLYVPEDREEIRVGLQAEGAKRFETVSDLYFRPFVESWNIVTAVPRRLLACSRAHIDSVSPTVSADR